MRLKRFFSNVLLVAGILMIVDAGLAVAWEEPISSLYTSLKQDQLSGDLDRLEQSERPESAERAELPESRAREGQPDDDIVRRARNLNDRVDSGEAIGRIHIPSIDVDFVVVQGTDEASVRKGPAHYTETVLPGEEGTVGIAGHRTTYKAPFRKVNKLRSGDRIEVEMPYGTFEYAVTGSKIVSPDTLDVFKSRSAERLALTACHPLYSAAERIIVYAERVEPELVASKSESPPAESDYAADDSFGVPLAVSLLLGVPSGLVGAVCSVVGLKEAPRRQRDGLIASLACSILVLAGFALVFMGVLG